MEKFSKIRHINKDFFITEIPCKWLTILEKDKVQEFLNSFFKEYKDNVILFFGNETALIKQAENLTRIGGDKRRIYFRIPKDTYLYIINRYPKRIISKLARAITKKLLEMV